MEGQSEPERLKFAADRLQRVLEGSQSLHSIVHNECILRNECNCTPYDELLGQLKKLEKGKSGPGTGLPIAPYLFGHQILEGRSEILK